MCLVDMSELPQPINNGKAFSKVAEWNSSLFFCITESLTPRILVRRKVLACFLLPQLLQSNVKARRAY